MIPLRGVGVCHPHSVFQWIAARRWQQLLVCPWLASRMLGLIGCLEVRKRRPQHVVRPGHLEHAVLDRHGAAAGVLLEAGDALHGAVQCLDVGESDPRVDDVEQRNF